MNEFKLDERLCNDTHYLGETSQSLVLLMNDRRWPWVILVPKLAEISEIHQLDTEQRTKLSNQTNQIAKFLAVQKPRGKINIGALGNIVRQLHVHVILRRENDANWPGPVWGFGKREPYDERQIEEFKSNISPIISAMQ